MKLVYSNVPPMRMSDQQYDLSSVFENEVLRSDEFVIASGYVSKKALNEIERIAENYTLKNVVILLGMYCIEGFPEGVYNTAIRIHQKWKENNKGEIRVTKSIKYHGKVYGFYNSGRIISGVVGSHNLSSLVQDANNLRQYELSAFTEELSECQEIDNHLKRLMSVPCSVPIDEVDNPIIIHEENTKLNNVEGVVKVSMSDVFAYKNSQTNILFDIPLKVPGIPGESNDFMKSNINKCYAKGRLNSRTGVVTERGWWETEIIVSKSITSHPDYPDRDTPFFVITDDGWKFKMHASGDHKKNLESDGDLKILGYWLKGRLVAAGVVEPVDSPAEDLKLVVEHGYDIYAHCKGVITYQKLARYGRTSVSLTKTLNKLADEAGIMRDVWVLSFLPKDVR